MNDCEPDRLDKTIEMMRAIAPADHSLHTADTADLRIAVAALVERKQLEIEADGDITRGA